MRLEKIETMTVVSTKEFNTHQEKYFELALNEGLYIQIGDNRLFVQNAEPKEPDIIFKPNSELRSCITMDEVRTRTREGIHQLFARE